MADLADDVRCLGEANFLLTREISGNDPACVKTQKIETRSLADIDVLAMSALRPRKRTLWAASAGRRGRRA
jgi:hypothetical protein